MDFEKKIFFAVKALMLHDGKFLAMHKSEIKENWLEPRGRMEFWGKCRRNCNEGSIRRNWTYYKTC